MGNKLMELAKDNPKVAMLIAGFLITVGGVMGNKLMETAVKVLKRPQALEQFVKVAEEIAEDVAEN